MALPSGRHLLTASQDNVRLWDLERAAGPKGKIPPYVVVPGHQGGVISQICEFSAMNPRASLANRARSPSDIDPRTQWMITASGNRGWDGTSSENVVIHQIKC